MRVYEGVGPSSGEVERRGARISARFQARTDPDRRAHSRPAAGPAVVCIGLFVVAGWMAVGLPHAAPGLAAPVRSAALAVGMAPMVVGSARPGVAVHWSQVTTSTAPSARNEANIAYDAADGYVVLFGGAPPSALNDTWTFANNTWTNITPSGSPPARQAASMVYDARDGYVVLFGGLGSSNTALRDTWTFSGGVWTNRTSPGGPSARFAGSITYDARAHRVVLFGGCTANLPLSTLCSGGGYNDTWSFVAGRWTPLHTTGAPTGRYAGMMAYDTRLGAAVLFGGEGRSGFMSDTWELNGTTWSMVTTSKAPSARSSGGIAYLPRSSSVILFGGAINNSRFGDTWSFANGTWTKLSLSPSPATRDLPGMMTYDAAGRYVLLWGGYDGSYFNDTWTLR